MPERTGRQSANTRSHEADGTVCAIKKAGRALIRQYAGAHFTRGDILVSWAPLLMSSGIEGQ
jgi:hypothetical protein